MKILKEIIPYIVIIVVVILIKTFFVTPIRVNGESMYPTLHEKDIMILNKIHYRFNEIERFDIVVIKTDQNYLIKRVIGLPGEHIEYKNNILYVNGKKQKEPVELPKTNDFDSDTFGMGNIPKDSYLVLGDNRENSLDSRAIGFIKKKYIIGKTQFTIFPFNRFGNKI